MIIQNAFTSGSSLLSTILLKMSNIGRVQTKFIEHILILILSIRGKANFLQFARYGHMNEKSYRNSFEKAFDWAEFNSKLIATNCSDELIIGFDPSFIAKSGKRTPEIGYFYSGCKGGFDRGIEIGCFSIIDIKQNTAYHFNAIQTSVVPKSNKENTLVDQYIDFFNLQSDKLSNISKILVADAYFSKVKYMTAVTCKGFELISRLRDDANLMYVYNGLNTGRGRPKKYDGKVDTKNIDKRRIRKEYQDEKMIIYSGVVYSISLAIKIRVAFVEFLDHTGCTKHTAIYYSTNLDRKATQLVSYYRARFQMEFNFRDAKQHTGLTNCQSISKQKLDFHFNATLTAVNIAKILSREKVSNDQTCVISIHDITTELANLHLMNLIISKYRNNPDFYKNNAELQEILNFGKIAA